MKTMYIHINNCYGGPCTYLKRVWNSPNEFRNELRKLQALTPEQIQKDYGNWDPLQCSEPVLVKIELAEDEEYFIDDYDGLEHIDFRKKCGTTSTCSRPIDLDLPEGVVWST